MVKILRPQRVALAVMLVVALLAATNWILSPELATRWLRAILALPLMWLCLALWHDWSLRGARRRGADDVSAVTRYFSSTLSLMIVGVGIWQVATLSLRVWVRTVGSGADLDAERRVLGVATGVVLIFVGNLMPKILTPFSILPPNLAARVTAARGFVGTSAVLLGVTTVLAFLFAPLEVATAVLRWALAAGSLALLGAIVWMNASPPAEDQ